MLKMITRPAVASGRSSGPTTLRARRAAPRPSGRAATTTGAAAAASGAGGRRAARCAAPHEVAEALQGARASCGASPRSGQVSRPGPPAWAPMAVPMAPRTRKAASTAASTERPLPSPSRWQQPRDGRQHEGQQHRQHERHQHVPPEVERGHDHRGRDQASPPRPRDCRWRAAAAGVGRSGPSGAIRSIGEAGKGGRATRSGIPPALCRVARGNVIGHAGDRDRPGCQDRHRNEGFAPCPVQPTSPPPPASLPAAGGAKRPLRLRVPRLAGLLAVAGGGRGRPGHRPERPRRGWPSTPATSWWSGWRACSRP